MDWLSTKRHGFAALSAEEQKSIADFAFIWSYFESEALGRNANYTSIVRLATMLEGTGKIDEARLAPVLAYFIARYVHGGVLSPHHPHLRLPPSHRALVNGVLLGTLTSPGERLAASLLIAFRFRNNLFHGEKWEYDLQGQRPNFEMASELLMATLEMQG
ncbi:MAG TPA: hypothetical protein VIP27_08430 [Variovorax sp.]